MKTFRTKFIIAKLSIRKLGCSSVLAKIRVIADWKLYNYDKHLPAVSTKLNL